MSDVPPPPPLRIYEIIIDRFTPLVGAACTGKVVPPPQDSALQCVVDHAAPHRQQQPVADGKNLQPLLRIYDILTDRFTPLVGAADVEHGTETPPPIDLGRLDPRLVAGWDLKSSRINDGKP
ncbi:hypothetical protein PAPYR_4243 [Paratrimastix pyriformis]|uniref:Uncharacterized protein n=1 Tax=Paratrimastix pyriformis TaxID=342808 RepID=A0ABQ8UKV0_9EUKA|nr:hypothetical protein PAPYR_4243 [Paratrimastix pyriformis]